MKCEECLPLVEDYFDGELDGRTTELVTRHLDSCAACAVAYRKLEREQELYLRYECDVEAGQGFWENVMARAADSPAPRAPGLLSNLRLRQMLGVFAAPRFSPSLTALIVLVAIGITAFLMSRANRVEKPPAPEGVARSIDPRTIPPTHVTSAAAPGEREKMTEDAAGAKGQPQPAQARGGKRGELVSAANRRTAARPGHPPTPDELVREAEQKYVAAIGMLSRDVSRRRSRLDPEVAERFERTLATLDRTITETRRAVREHPGDPLAAKYMLTAYARKVDVLREMAGY